VCCVCVCMCVYVCVVCVCVCVCVVCVCLCVCVCVVCVYVCVCARAVHTAVKTNNPHFVQQILGNSIPTSMTRVFDKTHTNLLNIFNRC